LRLGRSLKTCVRNLIPALTQFFISRYFNLVKVFCSTTVNKTLCLIPSVFPWGCKIGQPKKILVANVTNGNEIKI